MSPFGLSATTMGQAYSEQHTGSIIPCSNISSRCFSTLGFMVYATGKALKNSLLPTGTCKPCMPLVFQVHCPWRQTHVLLALSANLLVSQLLWPHRSALGRQGYCPNAARGTGIPSIQSRPNRFTPLVTTSNCSLLLTWLSASRIWTSVWPWMSTRDP